MGSNFSEHRKKTHVCARADVFTERNRPFHSPLWAWGCVFVSNLQNQSIRPIKQGMFIHRRCASRCGLVGGEVKKALTPLGLRQGLCSQPTACGCPSSASALSALLNIGKALFTMNWWPGDGV